MHIETTYEKWKILGVEVVGISGDQASQPFDFQKQKRLPFTLLSDPDGKVAKLFQCTSGKGGIIERFLMGINIPWNEAYSQRMDISYFQIWKTTLQEYKVDLIKDSETVMKFIKNKNQ